MSDGLPFDLLHVGQLQGSSCKSSLLYLPLENNNVFSLAARIAETLLKDCVIKGKYPYQKIMHDNTQLGMITKERGLVSLTIDGAKRVAKSKIYSVKIYDDFTLIGSVFAPGVKDADEEIRIGDEVIVIRNLLV
ncbi:unnamed protein product [marine sediment metagenome]|uniref:Uncharacterized protein n=1 Tax=marine sediment metagenome TaxID=412755 RepID=X1F8I6_9ZZZZ